MEAVLDLRTGVVAVPTTMVAIPSGSDERVPSTETAEADALSRVEVQLHEGEVLDESMPLPVVEVEAATPPASNSSEIAIDTDTDDDVILVAPPMEVIEVHDEDDEDVQIVGQSHAAIPKPLPDSSSTSAGGSGIKSRPRLLPIPPILPEIPEIDEALDDNLPVERLLGDLFDSHFGHIDFELPVLELPQSASMVIPSTSSSGHSLADAIHIKRNAEIAIQTEGATSLEACTQTDEVVAQPKKRKW